MARILYLSRVYPNNIIEVNGLWVEGLVRAMARRHNVRVVAPVPYCPAWLRIQQYAVNRKVLYHQELNGVEIFRPRYVSPPGYLLHSYLGEIYYHSIRRRIDRMHPEFPFDLIHAHFSYPDGYAAARLAKKYRVPMVFTEHAAWVPWMNDFPRVRKKALFAVEHSSAVIAGSSYLKDTISGFTGNTDKLNRIPIGVDTELFRPDDRTARERDTIIYVGRIHRTKGIDILFDALAELAKSRPGIRLLMVGGDMGYRDYLVQEQQLRRKATGMGLDPYIDYLGMQPHERVVELMRSSSALVLPSRRESFGSVLIEAIACGTPVVATRCGGPEDIVDDTVGRLVDAEDAQALAGGITHVLDHPGTYDAGRLHDIARERYSWESVADRTSALYAQVMAGSGETEH